MVITRLFEKGLEEVFMKKVLIALGFMALSFVSAHATFVFGDLSAIPETPVPGEPFILQLIMNDPSKYPIADAIVFAEFTPDVENAKTQSWKLDETKEEGVYQGEITVPIKGKYFLLLRDRTYRQEDALANLAVTVSDSMLFPVGLNSVIFPPTATGAYSVTTWIIWLVSIPVLGGLIVTIYVLTKAKSKAAEIKNKQAS